MGLNFFGVRGRSWCEGEGGGVAAARVAPDGQILITSVKHSREMASKGLAMCAGCGQFYAVHGGGLRQHWARGGVEQACAAAAEAARSASMTDEEAAKAIGRAAGSNTNAESSSWRGSGDGRPGPWREKKSNEQKLHPGLAAAAAGDVAGMAAAATATADDDQSGAAPAWDPATSCDGYGSDALQWAAGGGHLAACRWLVLERGVHVGGTRRKDGRTPLHWAARNGHLEVCQWLVAQAGGKKPTRGLLIFALFRGKEKEKYTPSTAPDEKEKPKSCRPAPFPFSLFAFCISPSIYISAWTCGLPSSAPPSSSLLQSECLLTVCPRRIYAVF